MQRAMENLTKDQAALGATRRNRAGRDQCAVPDVIIAHRLRDREQLRKRRAEAQEKDSIQWFLREQKKQQKRGRGGKRGRGRPRVKEVNLEPEPKLSRQSSPQAKAEPGPSDSAGPSELVPEEELPMLTYQDVISELQPGVVEELGARSQDPVGEEDVSKLAEAEIPEDWNTLLENEEEDNECSTDLLF